MKRFLITGAALLAAALTSGGAWAQGTVKIGVIAAFSGQFADTAAQIENGIKLYMKQHGDKVAGKKIEIIKKDTGGPNPDVAKRLAQELVVRDKVDILAGFTLTPEALGAASVAQEAKKLMMDMNAATSVITEKSQYIVRSSLTLPQIASTAGKWLATKGGAKKAYTMVSDFGPGIDAEKWFQSAFKEAGGEIIGSVRMPIANPDFSAFIQKAKARHPNAPAVLEQEAVILWESDRKDEAIKVAERVVKAKPQSFTNQKLIGEYYAQRDAVKTATAFEAYLTNRPTELQSGDVLPRIRLGFAYLANARSVLGDGDA